MDQEVLDVIKPLLIMGGSMTLVMLCRELRRGWMETVTIKQKRQRAKDCQKLGQEENEADQK